LDSVAPPGTRQFPREANADAANEDVDVYFMMPEDGVFALQAVRDSEKPKTVGYRTLT